MCVHMIMLSAWDGSGGDVCVCGGIWCVVVVFGMCMCGGIWLW